MMTASLLLLLWPQDPDESVFLNLHDAEELARFKMPREHFDYYAGCANDCVSSIANERD